MDILHVLLNCRISGSVCSISPIPVQFLPQYLPNSRYLSTTYLKVGQCLSKVLAVADVLACGLKHELVGGLSHDGDEQSLLGQLLHQVVETIVDLPEYSTAGNTHVLEEQLTRVLQTEVPQC